MNFLQTMRLALTPLSPIHIGCGEDFEPTNYLIEDNTLFAFDPSRARLPEPLARRLGELGEQADLLGIQRFFRDHRQHFLPHADVLIPVAPGLAADYEKRVGNVANREANGNRVFNDLSIERATQSNGQPYIPGSSLKGGLRTGMLDHLNDGRPPLSSERGRGPNSWDSARIESRLLQGDFATSPLRLVKPADLMPAGEIAREVLYALNHKKDRVVDRNGNERQPRGIASRKECIVAGQYRAFTGSLALHNLGEHREPTATPVGSLRPADFAGIARDSNRYHLPRLRAEIRMLDQRGFLDPAWKKGIEDLLAGDLRPLIDTGRVLLVRLGRFGGAESKTLSGEGVAQIKIMEGKGPDGRSRASFHSHTKTVWLAGRNTEDRRHLLPFGWALVEVEPQGDLSQLRDWCELQAASRPNMHDIRARFAQARADAAQHAERQRAEREATRLAEQARLAAAAEHALRQASLTPAMREIEAFVDGCAKRIEQLRGAKDKPNTVFQQKARALVDQAAAWDAAERTAAAKAIEDWLPRVVAIEVKELRKKFGLAALRGEAQG
ncbi:MAG: type III-A CRISPR-associated RAMP protein Csm5 [Candidatus Accumulibacter propinquus]|jgi:CRISPR-associated protein Csm5|uniref:type III-A CRISPR-associated RAMP protein Csm5 n=1 Tax=Candidatus Accumulibacter propinquus TaxID=2954380 RepID=UPI002FC3CCFA